MLTMNEVKVAGRLTTEPQHRDGGACRFCVAANRKYKGRDGELKEEVAFVDCEAWSGLGEQVARLPKGFPVLVEGHLKLNQWEDKDGNKRRQLVVSASRVHWLDAPRTASGQPHDDDADREREAERRSATRRAAEPAPAFTENEPPF